MFESSENSENSELSENSDERMFANVCSCILYTVYCIHHLMEALENSGSAGKFSTAVAALVKFDRNGKIWKGPGQLFRWIILDPARAKTARAHRTYVRIKKIRVNSYPYS